MIMIIILFVTRELRHDIQLVVALFCRQQSIMFSQKIDSTFRAPCLLKRTHTWRFDRTVAASNNSSSFE